MRLTKKLLLMFLLASGLVIIANNRSYSAIEESRFEERAEIAGDVDLESHFINLGISGSIIIYDQNSNRYYEHNPSRNTTVFPPASTFKIFNSLVALETGIIRNELEILTWDGIERELEVWNQDLNLRQAIKYSAVWFYQVLARRIGYETMNNWITRVGYGNSSLGKEEAIDGFWLSGELGITPKQQIDFLRRLEREDLLFSLRTIAIVKDILVVEQTPEYTIRAKTGWATSVTPQIGWYVGYLEQNNNRYFFATNINIVNREDLAARVAVTRLCLEELGLL